MLLVLVAASFLPLGNATAQSGGNLGFQGYVQLLAARARAEGVSEATITRMTWGLTLNQRVIDLDRGQPSISPTPPPVAPYLAKHINAALVQRGKNAWAESAHWADSAQRRYGVPPKMIFAIWGHETNYGRYTGNFDLANSLATLAYEGRRRQLFADEFIALLKMADQGVRRDQMVGSYAGAFGNPQFLPSVYLRLAVDGDGNGTRDIWNSRADTIASVANYFRDSGWRPGEPWGVGVSLPAGFDPGSVATKLEAPGCSRVHARFSAWKPVSEWRRLGLVPQAPINDNTMASLMQPDGLGTRAWLLTGNYRVILQYNCSNYYALSVGLLADEIAR
ncbi:MAG: lytic transglycosylase domain-containing protein [Novosphingobium sp.]